MSKQPFSPETLDRSWQRLSREEIAAGGTSLVFRITYSNGFREVEKCLMPKFQGKDEYEALQRREFEILEQINHPLIVRPYQIRCETTPWNAQTHTTIWEYIEGVPLSHFFDFLDQLSDEEREAWAYELLMQVASALHYLKSREVIHGDLAPENILIQKTGVIKLIDFGVSRKQCDPAIRFRVAGRNRFRAPELQTDGATSLSGDVFALGRVFEAVLGEELSGRTAHRRLIEQMCVERMIPTVKQMESGWFKGLDPLPASEFFIQTGRIARKTKLTLKPVLRVRRRLLMAAACFALLPLLSSWLPQEAILSVNSWPYSSFSVNRLGSDLRFETPVSGMKIPSGNLEVEFSIPSQRNRRVIRRINVQPGEHVKLFEDFQNLDTLLK